MKRLLILAALLAAFGVGPVHAQPGPVDLGDDPARTIAGRELPAGDARVDQARAWLKKLAEATGESEEQVAASSMKLTRFFFDTLKLRILPIEALEGMAALAAAGKPLSELTTGYFQARRNAPERSHAAAMATIGKK